MPSRRRPGDDGDCPASQIAHHAIRKEAAVLVDEGSLTFVSSASKWLMRSSCALTS